MQEQKMVGYYNLEKVENHCLRVFEILELGCTLAQFQ